MRTVHYLAIVVAFAGGVAGACGAFGGSDSGDQGGGNPDGGQLGADGGAGTTDGSMSQDAGTSDASKDAGLSGFGKRVFVSTSLFSAKMGASASNGLCIADAVDAGIVNASEFVGWLAEGTDPNPLAKLAVGDGWALMDGTPIFPNKAAIYTDGPLFPINRTARGDKVQTSGVWTGVHTDGGPGLICNGWSSYDPGNQGVTGDALRGPEWTDRQATDGCDKTFPIYCFQK